MVQRLEKLTRKELEALRERLSGNEAHVIVHPFFLGKPNPALEEHFIEGKHRDRLTIIFEEFDRLETTQKKLERLGVGPSDNVFLVSTKEWAPMPTAGWQKILERMGFLGIKNIEVDGRAHHYEDREKVDRNIKSEKAMRGDGKRRFRITQMLPKDAYYSILRTRNRVATGKVKVGAGCVGNTAARFRARGGFKVQLRRRFK